jgi:ABC-type thiamine transport system substrate-binding protein
MIKTFFVSALAFALAACATTNTHTVDTSTLASFKPGVTTIADVEAAFGEPINAIKMPDGTTQLQYTSKTAAEAQAPVPGSLMPRGASSKMVSTMLSFDPSGHFVRAWSN